MVPLLGLAFSSSSGILLWVLAEGLRHYISPEFLMFSAGEKAPDGLGRETNPSCEGAFTEWETVCANVGNREGCVHQAPEGSTLLKQSHSERLQYTHHFLWYSTHLKSQQVNPKDIKMYSPDGGKSTLCLKSPTVAQPLSIFCEDLIIWKSRESSLHVTWQLQPAVMASTATPTPGHNMCKKKNSMPWHSVINKLLSQSPWERVNNV